jgi:hypothetical protein
MFDQRLRRSPGFGEPGPAFLRFFSPKTAEFVAPISG